MRSPSLSTVRAVLIASVLLTSFHYTDNFVSIDSYPQPDWVTTGAVLVSWPLLTAFGVAGYLLYRSGRFELAHACLLVYSTTGLSSLGHFLSGSPDEFTTRGLVSIFTDAAAGSAVLAVTVCSMLAHRTRSAPAPSPR
jgi:hypothetical protein